VASIQSRFDGQIFPYLPAQLNPQIVSYLNSKTLRQFEQVSQTCSKVTELVWHALKKQKNIDFAWEIYRRSRHPHKYSYRLSRGVIKFVIYRYERSYEPKKITLDDPIKLQKLIADCPAFGAYVNLHCPKEGLNALTEKQEKQVEALSQVQEGGELLLYALFKATRLGSEKISKNGLYNFFQKAIDQRATCVSYLGVRILKDQVSIKWHQKLAIAAAQQKDFRGLEELIYHKDDINYSKKLYRLSHRFPPILCDLAHWCRTPQKKERYILQTIQGYEGKVPPKVWRLAAEIYSDLEKPIQADFFQTKLIASYKEGSVPADDLCKAASIKNQLNQWEETNELLTQAITRYEEKEKLNSAIFIEALYVKIKLEQWKQADPLIPKIFEFYKQEEEKIDDVRLLYYIGLIKFKLKDFEAAEKFLTNADDLLTKSMDRYESDLSRAILFCASTTKIHLKQWKEADHLLNRLIISLKDEVSANTWQKAGWIKVNLKQWPQADIYYSKAMTLYGGNVNGRIIAQAAWIKFYLGQWQSSIDLYAKATAYYRENVPENIRNQSDFVNATWEKMTTITQHDWS
jgi:hypothetical protein